MATISIKFSDFKSLAGNKRVYYYEEPHFFDFVYLVDGILVKTTLLKAEIDNMERFLSDPLFYGATRLTFRIPDEKDDSLVKIPIPIYPTEDPQVVGEIQDVQDVELTEPDVQREGVGEE